MGKYTDELIDMAKQVNENPPKREMDMLFTIGEQMSVSLMAMAMNSLKVPAISERIPGGNAYNFSVWQCASEENRC